MHRAGYLTGYSSYDYRDGWSAEENENADRLGVVGSVYLHLPVPAALDLADRLMRLLPLPLTLAHACPNPRGIGTHGWYALLFDVEWLERVERAVDTLAAFVAGAGPEEWERLKALSAPALLDSQSART